MTLRVNRGGSGPKREPTNLITKELVNELLIWIQSNGFIVKDRPHIYQDGTWLVRFFSQVLDAVEPTVNLQTKEIVGVEQPRVSFANRIRILFGKQVTLPQVKFLWKTNNQEVANHHTVMRGLFYIRTLPQPHIELHLETVPVRETYTPQQRRIIDAALTNSVREWEAAVGRATRAGLKVKPQRPTIRTLQPNKSSIRVDHKVRIPLSGMDSLKDFRKAIEMWM